MFDQKASEILLIFFQIKKPIFSSSHELAVLNIEHQKHQSTCRILLYVHRKLTAV